jgi:hypothetical protein
MSNIVVTMTLHMDNIAMTRIMRRDKLVSNFHMMKVVLIS